MGTINLKSMDNHQHDASNGVSLVLGFILAFTNHLTGFLNNIQITANWDGWFQALILGIVGSGGSYLGNKLWKYIDKKFKKNKKED